MCSFAKVFRGDLSLMSLKLLYYTVPCVDHVGGHLRSKITAVDSASPRQHLRALFPCELTSMSCWSALSSSLVNDGTPGSPHPEPEPIIIIIIIISVFFIRHQTPKIHDTQKWELRRFAVPWALLRRCSNCARFARMGSASADVRHTWRRALSKQTL